MGKFIIGGLFILIGIIAGLYVGGYLLFVGGIVQLISAIQVAFTLGTALNALSVAMGILKIACAGIIGVLVFMFCALIGGKFIVS